MTKPRAISTNGIYHVVVRGNNKNDVFCDDEDNLKFLYILKDLKEKNNNLEIYAFCLMVNHAHLMLRLQDKPLAVLMRSAILRYVKWYNKKYERTGHLFQDRFFSNPVTDSRYFLAGLQYIYNNPIKAGLCNSPSAYKWSSFRQLFMQVPMLPSITPPIDKLPLGKRLLTIMDSNLPLDNWEPSEILFDTDAIEILKNTIGLAEWKDAQNLSPEALKICVSCLLQQGSSARQISRILGVNRHNIKKYLQ